MRKNIVPVCIESIAQDGNTLPPAPSKRKSTGRPKKQRIRKRSRWAHEPEKSNIVCSRCHKRGHNVRTCLAREDLVNQGDNENGTRESQSEEENMRDLDLS